MDYRELELGSLITLNYGKSLPKAKRIEGKYPVYGSGGVTGYHNEYLVEGPGIVLGRKGTVGSLYFEKEKFFPIDTTYYISPSNEYDLKYVYYLLGSLGLTSMNTHSAVPGLNRNEVYSKKIKLPSLEDQKQVSTFLTIFEEKIELNNQMIATLEELAAALFKRWFVDFEFPDENGNPYKSSGGKMVNSELGEIPEGWVVKSLIQIANYKNGLAMQKFRPIDKGKSLPVLKIKELNQGFTDLSSDRCSTAISRDVKVFDGDVIFSWSGTLLVKLWTGGEAGLNQHLFKVTSGNFEKWFYYLYTKYYLNQFIAIAKDKATTMGHIKRENLNNAKVCFPVNEELWVIFSNIFSALIDKLIELGLENNSLEGVRNNLLPKLLSGEINLDFH